MTKISRKVNLARFGADLPFCCKPAPRFKCLVLCLPSWAFATNITDANQAAQLAADAESSAYIATTLVNAQPYFDSLASYSFDTQRKFNLLKLNGGQPKDETKRARLSYLVSHMEVRGFVKPCSALYCALHGRLRCVWLDAVCDACSCVLCPRHVPTCPKCGH
jgi:hypothetical protein